SIVLVDVAATNANLHTLHNIQTVDATAETGTDLVQFATDTAVTANLGTHAYLTVNALGGTNGDVIVNFTGNNQFITTDGGADTFNAGAVGHAGEQLSSGSGNDIFNFNTANFLNQVVKVDGGTGSDTVNYTSNAVQDLDQVVNVETIHFNNGTVFEGPATE